MSCLASNRYRGEITVNSTNYAFFRLSEWRLATPTTVIDFEQNILSIVGPGECKPALMFSAVRTDDPDDGTPITDGSYRSTTGFAHFRETVAPAGFFWYCIGVAGRLQTGQTGQSVIQLTLDVTAKTCGAGLGSKTTEVHPFMTGTDEANAVITPITDWSPTLSVDKIVAVFLVLGLLAANTLEYALYVRTAKDRDAPGDWVLVETQYVRPTAAGNSSRNTGELSPPAGANFSTTSWFQLGVAVRKWSSATSNPRATIKSSSAVRYT